MLNIEHNAHVVQIVAYIILYILYANDKMMRIFLYLYFFCN